MNLYNRFHEISEKAAIIIYGSVLLVTILVLKLVFGM